MSHNAPPIPLGLMPVAAALLSLSLLTLGRALYLQLVPRSQPRVNPHRNQATILSSPRTFYVAAFLLFLAYSYTIGRVQGAILKREHAQFDPYAILQVAPPDDPQHNNNSDYKTIVTAAYRSLVKQVHPSNPETGSRDKFERVVLAYRALTEDAAAAQWKQHGHPDGALLTPVFMLQFPKWLVAWDEAVAMSMKVVYSSMFLVVIAMGVLSRMQSKRDKEDDLAEDDFAVMQNQVIQQDLQHLAKHITPDMTHQQVLYVALSAPKMMVQWANADLRRIEKLKEEKLAQLEQEKKKTKKSGNAWDDLLENDDGWADENEDEDEEARAARLAEQEKQKQLEEMKSAAKKAAMLLEGLDEGVVGRRWVQRTLTQAQFWPPKDIASLKKMVSVDPLADEAVSRILCMLTGRIHSEFLNSHKELLAAAAAGPPPLIDQTYFGANITFRIRMRLLLDAVQRLATKLRCAKLLKTTIEAVGMFTAGCQAHEADRCRKHLMKTFKCIPQLQLLKDPAPSVSTPGADNIIAGDAGTILEFSVQRVHAQPWLAAHIEQWKQKNIPPQIAFESFREIWWVIVECECLDDARKVRWHGRINLEDPFLKQLEIGREKVDLFENQHNSRRDFIYALPLVIANPKQDMLTGKISFDAPSEPGRYKFTITLKSSEHLGCDTEFSVEATVLSTKEGGRPARVAPAETDNDPSAEEPTQEESTSEGKKER